MLIVRCKDVNRYVCVYIILDNELGSIKPDDMSNKNKYIMLSNIGWLMCPLQWLYYKS